MKTRRNLLDNKTNVIFSRMIPDEISSSYVAATSLDLG
jgi:hypothetical protein